MRKQSRLFDPTSHAGIIVSGSPNTTVNTLLLVRLFDIHVCPIHGVNVVVTCSSKVQTNRRGNARAGDLCACGAAIIPATPDTYTTE